MATRLKATTTIKYGDGWSTKYAQPGDIFELDETKYAASIEQLLASGDAELVRAPNAAKPDAHA